MNTLCSLIWGRSWLVLTRFTPGNTIVHNVFIFDLYFGHTLKYSLSALYVSIWPGHLFIYLFIWLSKTKIRLYFKHSRTFQPKSVFIIQLFLILKYASVIVLCSFTVFITTDIAKKYDCIGFFIWRTEMGEKKLVMIGVWDKDIEQKKSIRLIWHFMFTLYLPVCHVHI